jgi:hypothetical protein
MSPPLAPFTGHLFKSMAFHHKEGDRHPSQTVYPIFFCNLSTSVDSFMTKECLCPNRAETDA